VIFFRFHKGLKTTSVPEVGEFPCPECSVDRLYSLTAVHETLGVFDRLMRGIQGNVRETRVTCQVCGLTFPGDIRDRSLYRDRAAEQLLLQRLRTNLTTETTTAETHAAQNPLG
jgi:transcription elongation factor Elf1